MDILIGGAFGAAIVFAALAIVWVIHRRRALTRTTTAPDVQRLRVWTAEQLSTLTVEQQEAMRLWAWAERQNWMVVTENVNLGNEFPRAKEALLS
jgi:hypothetical protein